MAVLDTAAAGVCPLEQATTTLIYLRRFSADAAGREEEYERELTQV